MFGCGKPEPRETERDAHGDVGGGAIFEELQERSPPEHVTSVTCRGGQQANRCVFEREATGRGERETAEAVSVS